MLFRPTSGGHEHAQLVAGLVCLFMYSISELFLSIQFLYSVLAGGQCLMFVGWAVALRENGTTGWSDIGDGQPL